MSMTLLAWKSPVVPDACAADMLLRRWYKRRDDRELDPSENIAAFANELSALYPDEGRSPWAEFPFVRTERIVELRVNDSVADLLFFDELQNLAIKHRLVVYDPGTGEFHAPIDPVEAWKVPPSKPVHWIKAAAMVAGLAGLTWLAWIAPIGWLHWPLAGIGAFFTLAAVFVVGAMIAGALGKLDGPPPDEPCAKDEAPL